MVQNFALFADGLYSYHEKKNRESLNVRTTCGLNTEKARKLKPRQFLLETILAKARKFAPAKIFRYTVYVWYS